MGHGVGVLMKSGGAVWTRAMIYNKMEQEVLLYGSKIWVIMNAMMKVMKGFNCHIDKRIDGNTACQVGEEG